MKAEINKIEKKYAKKLGGYRQINSGAIPNKRYKGDVKISKLKGDFKHTKHRSFTITQEMLQKIYNECYYSEYPFIYIIFENVPRVFQEWAIIPGDLFNEFKEWLNRKT